jgi:CRP-like cAMP-binding protein
MLTITKNRPVDYQRAPKSPLSTIDPFKNIPPGALREIEKHVIEKTYPKHEYIFMEDDKADYVWFVKEGHIKLAHYSMEGRSQTFCMMGPMGMFGVSALGQGEYGVYSMAETEATVISIPVQVFQDIMGKYPETAKAVVLHMSKLLRRAKEMEMISVASAEKRLLHTLLEMAGEYGTTIPMTRREISEMAGTSVETCIRIFSRLEDAGQISSVHGKIMVKSLHHLRNRMEEL